AKQWRMLVMAPADRLRLFLWLWVLIPVIFFSFSTSKLPGYILPVLPPVAMIIGGGLEQWWSEPQQIRLKWLSRLTALLIILVAIGVGWRGDNELGVSARAAWMAGAAAGVVACIYLGL